MKRGIFSLRRLRWKLTLSYTLVTVVALLALELLPLSALVAFLSSELWPAFIAQQIRDSFAPQLEEPLTREPPDTEALKEALTPFSNSSDGSGTSSDAPERDVGLEGALDQGSLFVLVVEHIFPAIRAGALSYVLKEVGPDELAEAVRKAADGEAVLHPRVAARVVRELHGARRDEMNGELEVLKLIAEGMSNHDIASRLYASEKTVKSHVSNILGKLHLAERAQATVSAWRQGVVRLD